MKQFFILTIFFSTLFCCKENNNKRNKEFVEKYKKNDFSIFKEKIIFVRGFNQGNPIIYIYDESHNKRCKGFISYCYSREVDSILEIKPFFFSDSCDINFERFPKKTIKEFLKYDINCIEVDSNDNVFVKVMFFEGPANLIRFSNKKYITNKYKKEWKNINGSWYEKI